MFTPPPSTRHTQRHLTSAGTCAWHKREILNRVSRTNSGSAPAPIGTLPTVAYTFNMSRACLAVTHMACVTKIVRRPGITNAHVSNRSSPLPTCCLHTRHRARPVGAVLNRYTLGSALNEPFLRRFIPRAPLPTLTRRPSPACCSRGPLSDGCCVAKASRSVATRGRACASGSPRRHGNTPVALVGWLAVCVPPALAARSQQSHDRIQPTRGRVSSHQCVLLLR
jgi:hypothetical protein